MTLGFFLGGGTVSLLYVVWSRSTAGLSARLFRRVLRLPNKDVPSFLDRELASLPPSRGAAILRRVARLMRRFERRWPPPFLRALETAADVMVLLDRPMEDLDWEARQRLASGIDRHREALEGVLTLLTEERHTEIRRDYQALVLQEDLFASLLCCDSPSHVAALRGELQELSRWVSDFSGNLYIEHDLLRDLEGILEPFELFGRLRSPEDRVLVLSQALAKVLKASERDSQGSAFALVQGDWVLESLRQLLIKAIRGIRQKAELEFEVRSKILTTKREAVVVLEIRNTGQGNAQNIEVEMLPSEDHFAILNRRGEVKSLLRGQVVRLEFLIEPRISDRVRLDFEITYGDLEHRDNRLAFADTVEFRQLRSPVVFKPLRPNPYVVGRPLSESDLFFGRDETFARLESNLRGAHQDNVVVLMGPRRMGKTSVLRRLPQLLGEAYAPVLLDLQGMIGSGDVAFFKELVEGLTDELEDLGIEVEEPPPEKLERDPGTTFRRHFLKPVRRALGDRRLLLMFDEFEVLEARIRCGDLQPRILSYFRSLIQHEPGVSFILAGTHRLDELTRDYWGVLFNIAVYLEVGHLSEDEMRRLFTEPTRGSFEIDSLALDKAWQLTGGHPHFCQLVARELIEYRNQHQLSYLTVQDINAVAERVLERGQLHISYLWEEASPAEQHLLLTVRELLVSKGLATLAAVRQRLEEQGIATSDIQPALRQMVRKEILQDNAGFLTFRIELLELWLDSQNDRPILPHLAEPSTGST